MRRLRDREAVDNGDGDASECGATAGEVREQEKVVYPHYQDSHYRCSEVEIETPVAW